MDWPAIFFPTLALGIAIGLFLGYIWFDDGR